MSIPEEGLSVLCGCPADSVKHLIKPGLISTFSHDGKTFETGPNAILRSDLAVQNGEFANLAEFPVLQTRIGREWPCRVTCETTEPNPSSSGSTDR